MPSPRDENFLRGEQVGQGGRLSSLNKLIENPVFQTGFALVSARRRLVRALFHHWEFL